MDGEAYWATVHGVANNQTQLNAQTQEIFKSFLAWGSLRQFWLVSLECVPCLSFASLVSQSVQSLSHVRLFATP